MSWDAWATDNPKEAEDPTWGDYGKAIGGTAAGIAAGSSGILRQAFEAGQHPNAATLFRELQGAARSAGSDIEESMTPTGRERLNAGVTSPEFWAHPVSSLALKATGMTPYLAASIFPAALISEGTAALAAAGGTAGWLAAGDVVDEITKKPDQMSDADLRKGSSLYNGLREDMDERAAREQYNRVVLGAKPLVAFALGAGTGLFGPAGQVVRGLKGTGRHGFVHGALEGGATEFAEEGYGGLAAQQAEIEGGTRKDYNADEILDRALTGAVLGTGFGAATSIGGGKGKAKADEIRAKGTGEEDVEVQAPAGQTGVAVPEENIPATPAARASKKGVSVGVDPAIVEALNEKTQAPPAATPPVEPPVPTPPPQQAAPPAPQAPSPPPAAQPQQAPVSPPAGPAAGVTPEVTAPPAQQPAGVTPAKPQLDEATLTEMAKRGFLPEEAAQLTPEQIQQIIKTPVSAPTDVSSRARTPESPSEPSATGEGATAPTNLPPATTPMASATEQVPTAPTVSPTTTKEGGPGGPPGPAVETAEVSEKPKPHKKGKEYDVSTAKRAEHAKALYEAHREPLGESFGDKPVKREVREAMAKKIDAILAKAAEQGLVPRESLPDEVRIEKAGQTPQQKHQRAMSIPERASGETSPHVIHLRELIGVRNALRGQKFGPKSDERARVNDFLAEHNVGEKGLALLAERRLVEGARRKAVRGSGIAAAATKVTKGSEDLSAGKGRVLEGEELAAAAAQYNQPAQPKPAEKIAEIKKSAAEEGKEIAAAAGPITKEEQIEGASSLAAEVRAKHPEAGPEGKGKAKAKEVQDKTRVEASPELLQAADKHLDNLNNLRLRNPVQKARRDAEVKKFNELTADALKTGDWSAVQKAMAELGVKVPKAKKAEPKEPAKAAEAVREVQPQTAEEETAPPAKEPVREKITEETKPEPTKPEPEVTPEVIKPAPVAEKKGVIDIEMRRQLGVMGYSHGDIQKMTEAKANHILDEGIVKGTEEATTEEGVPEGLTARQQKEFLKLGPEQQKAVRAALEARSPASDKQQGRMEKDIAAMVAEMDEDMSLDELVRSLHNRKEIRLNKDEHDIWDTSIHKARDLFGHDDDALGEPMQASELLRAINLEHLPKFPRYIQEFVRKRLSEILSKTPVYMATNELVADTMGTAHHKAPGGYFTRDNKAGPGHIVINELVREEPGGFARVLIHEALHAALEHRLVTDKTFRTKIKILMTVLDRDVSKKDRKHVNYALKDEHEFVSEALSNKDMQRIMSKMDIEPEVAEALGIRQKELKSHTLWGAFVAKVRQTLKIPESTYNLLDETLKVVAPHLEAERGGAIKAGRYQAYSSEGKQAAALNIDRLRDAAAGTAIDTKTNLSGGLARAKNKVSTLWQMARRNEQYFGPSKILHRLFEARAFMERAKDTILEKYGGLKATVAIAKAERTHPEAMRLAKDVLFDGSLHDVNIEGNNDHLGKDKLMGVQAKNEVARLQKAWADPRIDPVRNTIRNAVKFYKDIHNAVSRETINNILAEGNIHDPALAERIHNDGLTEADRETWADSKLVNALDQVKELKRRHGWYVPFRRYGDFSSTANHELSTPANATKINDNTLQFVDPTPKNGEYGNARARAAVKGYLRSNSHTPQGNKLTPHQIQKVWVDKNNPSEIIEKEQPDAIPAYRVAMQTQHTEFHATEAEALNSKALLAEAGLVGSRVHTREKAYQNDRNIQEAMGAVLRSLEKQQRYKDADETQRAAMREMFHDLSLGMSGTTSIKNSMKQRRNVAGMSRDLGRVTGDYARMTTNHLAKLQHRPKIDKIFAEMREYKEAHKDDNNNIRREEVYQEFVDRVYGSAAKAAEEHKPGVVSRLLQVTRLSFLAGPSYHLINAHEPWTTSLPVIGGDHGIAATTRALLDSYNIIGGRAGVMSGVRDMAKAYTNDAGFTNYVKLFKETIGKSKVAGSDKISRMQDVIDYMDARNLYSNASIFEVGKFANPEGNVAGRALDRADLMANQVGTAIEAVNRTVTGLTAYNLEYKKNGGNHEAAMHYAYTKAHETMGDYSNWNAAPLFNTKYGKPLLQFKKFPQKTYYLLGNIMGGALKGDPQAMKQFAGLMVTHGLVAGALGMPTEPFKLALVAANMVGATGFTPDDYEYAVRQLAARVAGQKGGEILSKGLYRGLGIEVSGRMGLDSLLVRGTPKSQKDTDIKTFLFDTMAGASGSFLLNQVQGAQAAFKGDWTTAIEKISPLRTVGDITKAAVGLSGEKKGAGGKTTQEQFGGWDATVRALGFTPSSKAELGAMQGAFKRESMRESGERTALTKAWVAATGADKVKAQRAVQRYNEGRPRDEQISQKDLTNAARRVKTEEKTTEHGITTSRRTEAIYERAAGVFNP